MLWFVSLFFCVKTLNNEGALALPPTLRLCEGLEFEIRLTSGNDYLKRDYEITEKFFRTSPAPNQSR